MATTEEYFSDKVSDFVLDELKKLEKWYAKSVEI